MKVAIFAVCFVLASVVIGQPLPVPAPVPVPAPLPVPVPALGMGMGMGLGMGLGMPFGPLGLGLGLGMPFGPLGLGAGLLFRRPLMRLALMGGLLGKRDLTEMEAMLNTINANSSVCSISSENSTLICHIVAKNENLECQVTPKFEKLGRLNLTTINMDVVPEKINSEDIFRIHSNKTEDKFTFVDSESKKPVTLSLFNSDKITEQGFLVRDEKCWSRFETLLRESNEKNVRLSIFWADN